MLVKVSISQFAPVKTDQKITKDVALQHNSDVTMGNYKKSIVAKSAVETYSKLTGAIRNEYMRRTLPWTNEGDRILSQLGYLDFAEWIRREKHDWETAVGTFLANWESYVQDARARLNGAFNIDDYPSMNQLERKFEFRWKVRPLPSASDWRVDLGAEEVSAIRQDIEADLQATVDIAVQDVYQRIKTVTSAMVTRLRLYDPAKPGEHSFRDSLVGNVKDLLDILPSLNISNDPNIGKFYSDMHDLVRFDAKELRDNSFSRGEIANRAEAILTQLRQFIA